MASFCRWCGSSQLAASAFRLRDYLPMFLLRVPARCRVCSKRQHIWIFDAGPLLKRKKKPTT
jgi:hypothetical protein